MHKKLIRSAVSAGLLLTQPAVWAQQTASEPAAPAAAEAKPSWWQRLFDSGRDDSTETVKLQPAYPVEIRVADKTVREMLSEHLPLISYQQKEVLDKEQVEFLAEDAVSDALGMLKTEGYFNSKATLTAQGNGYVLDVDLGPRTVIDDVSLAITGDILQDSDLGSYYKNALKNWSLPVGEAFRQDNWTNSKAAALAAVTRQKYPLAAFSQTQATVNPNTQKADLSLNIDSRQPVYFGDFEISGTERYPAKIVSGLAKFQAGDPYSLDQLLDYQQALESDGHYSGASVQADFDRLDGDRVPVKVTVSEVKRQKVDIGIGFDSVYGLGGNIGYNHYNLFGKGYTGSIAAAADRYQSSLGLGISQPRNSHGRYWTSNLAFNRSTTQLLEKNLLSSGIWYVSDRNNIEARYGLEFFFENSKIPDSNYPLGTSHATMLTAAWRHQNLETTLRPANGYYIDGKIGSTLGKLLSSAMMVRGYLAAGYYFTPENKKLGTLVARGNLGYVYTQNRDEVPSSLMFRSGGSASVRGYELDSIGRITPSGAVLPDRALAVASLEYQIPIKNDFALALFQDVGGVDFNFKKMQFKHGSGLGVRWFSPVAPFSFDIAYGHQDKKIRWHISLGTRF